MTKLFDIKGYWNMDYDWNFNNKDMWEGKILLQDNGWFEGLVVDPNSSYKKDRFIFGVYHPEKVIDLYKFAPFSVSSPLVFHGEIDTDGYYGQFESIGLFGTMPCGNSHIITKSAETIRQGIEDETKELEEKIQKYKDTTMDEITTDFYKNSLAIRRTMTESVLRNYEGKEFTQEEIDELSEEFEPVNDRILKSTEEEAKKLAKKMPDTMYDDDDDFPF